MKRLVVALAALLLAGNALAGNYKILTDVAGPSVTKTTVSTGDTVSVAYKVYGSPCWKAAWFKAYYDSTVFVPIRFRTADSMGAISSFDDVTTRAAKCGTKYADADIWLMYYAPGDGVARCDTITIGTIDYLAIGADSTGLPFLTSCGTRSPHPLLADGRATGLGWDTETVAILNSLSSEAAVVDTFGNYVTPADTVNWVARNDTVIVHGAANDGCVGNWAGHPPKQGKGAAAADSLTYCAPLAFILALKDSSVADGDSVEAYLYAYADSVSSLEGYIEWSYLDIAGKIAHLPGRRTFAASDTLNPLRRGGTVGWRQALAGYTAFDSIAFYFDCDVNPNCPQRCELDEGFPDCTTGPTAWRTSQTWGTGTGIIPCTREGVPTDTICGPIMRVAYWKAFNISPTKKSSIADTLLKFWLVPQLQETYAIGPLPLGVATPLANYNAPVSQQVYSTAYYGHANVYDKGRIYLYERAQSTPWLRARYFYLRGVGQYSTGN